jgi:lipopolysaccharide heptosyltransferase II
MIAAEWRHARRILCIRLDYLGDVLMTTPAIRALRESLPGACITLLSSGSGAAAARHIPEIDEAIVYQPPWLKSSEPHPPADDLAMVETLARQGFDAAIIFTVYSQNPLPSAMLCHLAGIPLRLAHCRENPYRLLTHWVPEPEPQLRVRHEVRRQLDLVATVGARTADERLSFRVAEADRNRVRELLARLGMAPRRHWIAIHPGATAPSRRYPEELMAAAARELAERTGCRIILTGSKEEMPLAARIAAQVPGSHSLAGILSLGELAALISLAPVLVANNTGPAHIAAAIGTPVVDLYALTNPQHAPWQVRSRVLYHDVPCRFCYKSVCPQKHQQCLALIPPSQVAAAAIELLERSDDPRMPQDNDLLPAAW